MSEIEISPISDWCVWENLIKKAGNFHLYLKKFYIEEISKEDIYLVHSKKQEIAIFLLCKEKNEANYFSPYQGINFLDQNKISVKKKQQVISEILDFSINKHKKIMFALNPEMYDIRGFQFWHFLQKDIEMKIDPKYTGIIYLNKYSNYEAYLSSLRKEMRKIFFDSEFKFELRDGESQLEVFIELYRKTFLRQNIEIDLELLHVLRRKILNGLRENHMKLEVAYLEGKIPVSAVVTAMETNMHYYFAGAQDPKYRYTNANSFLLLKILENTYMKSLNFDMVGINSPNRAFFKEKFGGVAKVYFNIEVSNYK